jgi:hypothetical protein
MANKGFLLVLMQPPATLEEEFNAWYDTEHVPERLSVPGFETGLRFVAQAGVPRYMAMYDLTHAEVLDTPDYARVSGVNFTPWTKRVTSRVKIYRSAGTQVYPGKTLTRRSARVLLVRFRALPPTAEKSVVAGLRENFEGRAEVSQVRVFAYPTPDGTDFLGFVEMRAPCGEQLALPTFGVYADAIDLVNTYAPY